MKIGKLIKRTLIIILSILAFFFIVNYLLGVFFFKHYLDRDPEITNIKLSNFNVISSKPFFFKVDNKLYYSANGILDYSLKPIWKGKIEEAFISPNNKYALLYNNKHLILINSIGEELFKISNCTKLHSIEENRENERFKGSEIQWSKYSDFFLIAQDRIWYKNYSKKNKSSIYKYTIADNSFKPFLNLDEELEESFMLSRNSKYLYYEFSTKRGDLAFRKVDLFSKKIISEHFQTDSLRLTNITPDSIFINYNKKDKFDNNSYNLQSVITSAQVLDTLGLYYKDKDTLVKLLSGTYGYDNFEGEYMGYFYNGYFLPGNRFFIANIYAKNLPRQLVIDTKTFQVMKLDKSTEFYFNINSNDCPDFVLRYEIEPNFKYATSVSLEIEGKIDSTNTKLKIIPTPKLSVLVLPPYDLIANEGISPNVQEYLETEIAKDTSLILIKFPYKQLKNIPYQNIYDKKYCNPILDKEKADIIVMSKLILAKRTENIKTCTWNFEIKFYKVKTNSQIVSKIKAFNLTAEEINNLLKSKQHELTTEFKTTKPYQN